MAGGMARAQAGARRTPSLPARGAAEGAAGDETGAERSAAGRDAGAEASETACSAELERAHERYRSRLEAVALRILGDPDEAQDVVQRVFLALRTVRFRGQSTPWTYLYRAAVNGALNVLRARRRRERVERAVLEQGAAPVAEPEASAEAQVLQGEILAAVARALLRVRPQHRRVLTLRILHGLSNTEIARREGLPLATVGTWLRRGRAELQKGLRPLLREMGRDEP